MKQWVYHNKVSKQDRLTSDLNNLGENGWEVYSVESLRDEFENTFILWCKKEIEKTDILND